MEVSHLRYLHRTLLVMQVLTQSQVLLSPAFSQVLEIFQVFPLGLTTTLSILTSPQAPCSPPSPQLKLLQTICLDCQIFQPALKACPKALCSCLRDLFLPRLEDREAPLLFLGTQ